MTPSDLGSSGIWDNHQRGSIGDFLKEKIQQGSDLSFVSAYFTIYAYAALKGQLDQINQLRFLFGEPQFIQSLDPDKTEKKALCDLFDQETESGAKRDKYSDLLSKAIKSIVHTFQKRTAAGRQFGRSFVIPDQQEQASYASDFKLITWLVVKSGKEND